MIDVWVILQTAMVTLLAMAAYFALMIAGAALACYVIGWIIGAITVVKAVGFKNMFRSWTIFKAFAHDAHHSGKGLVSEIFGYKRHVIYVPRT